MRVGRNSKSVETALVQASARQPSICVTVGRNPHLVTAMCSVMGSANVSQGQRALGHLWGCVPRARASCGRRRAGFVNCLQSTRHSLGLERARGFFAFDVRRSWRTCQEASVRELHQTAGLRMQLLHAHAIAQRVLKPKCVTVPAQAILAQGFGSSGEPGLDFVGFGLQVLLLA